MKKIRILIADDHKIMRIGLVSLLTVQKDMTVIGEADDGPTAVEMANALKPDVVLLDLMMPRMNGAEATEKILYSNPNIGVVILTSFSTSAEMNKAISNGARGAQAKESPTEDLIEAIRIVAEGGTAIAPDIQQNVESDPLPPPLTERQKEILISVTRGLSNHDIAKQFGISPVSVKKHLSVIFAKLGVATRTEAVAYALRKQMLKL